MASAFLTWFLFPLLLLLWVAFLLPLYNSYPLGYQNSHPMYDHGSDASCIDSYRVSFGVYGPYEPWVRYCLVYYAARFPC
jgi:hypothetical protein